MLKTQVLQEEEDPDTPKPPTPKKIIVSGGFCGFGIAEDLLRIDFSTPEEAPEEYKAVAFFEEPRTIRPGVSGQKSSQHCFETEQSELTESKTCICNSTLIISIFHLSKSLT